MTTFRFITIDGTAVESPFSIVPVNYPTVNSPKTAMGDPLYYTAPEDVTLLPNVYKVELNRSASNDWFITGSNVTASANIISGSYSTGSLCSVIFDLIDHVSTPEAVKSVDIAPIETNVGFNDSFVLEDKIRKITDTVGGFTCSLVPQAYWVTFNGAKKNTKYRILVPNSASVNSSDIIVTSYNVSSTITPKNQSEYGYTAQASDARYMRSGSVTGVTYPLINPSMQWSSGSTAQMTTLSQAPDKKGVVLWDAGSDTNVFSTHDETFTVENLVSNIRVSAPILTTGAGGQFTQGQLDLTGNGDTLTANGLNIAVHSEEGGESVYIGRLDSAGPAGFHGDLFGTASVSNTSSYGLNFKANTITSAGDIQAVAGNYLVADGYALRFPSGRLTVAATDKLKVLNAAGNGLGGLHADNCFISQSAHTGLTSSIQHTTQLNMRNEGNIFLYDSSEGNYSTIAHTSEGQRFQTTKAFVFKGYKDSAYQPQFVISASTGNVGIGHTSPAARLTVSSSGNVPVFNAHGNNGYAMLQVKSDGVIGVPYNSHLKWSGDADGGNAGDTGLVRQEAGQLKVTNGSTGTGTITASKAYLNGATGDGSNTVMNVYSASVQKLKIDGQGGLYTGDFQRIDDSVAINTTSMRARSGFVYAIGPNTTYINPDVGFSRQGVGIAAIGNGTSGNSAATLVVNNISSSQIAIGTATPSSSLHIHGTSGDVEVRISNTAAANSLFGFYEGHDGKDGFRVNYDGVNNCFSIFARENSTDYTTRGLSILRADGKVGIGTLTPAYNLDVTGSARFATGYYLGNSANPPWIYSFSGVGYTSPKPAGKGIGFYSYNGAPNEIGTSFSGDTVVATSGEYSNLYLARGFNPTAGSGIYNCLYIGGSISQSAAATGISRGIYINTTLTNAADFRAIEANGKCVFGPISATQLTSSIGVVNGNLTVANNGNFNVLAGGYIAQNGGTSYLGNTITNLNTTTDLVVKSRTDANNLILQNVAGAKVVIGASSTTPSTLTHYGNIILDSSPTGGWTRVIKCNDVTDYDGGSLHLRGGNAPYTGGYTSGHVVIGAGSTPGGAPGEEGVTWDYGGGSVLIFGGNGNQSVGNVLLAYSGSTSTNGVAVGNVAIGQGSDKINRLAVNGNISCSVITASVIVGLPMGQLHCHDKTNSQTIANGTTYTVLTNFNTGSYGLGGVTYDTANSRMLLPKKGYYQVVGNLSITSDTNNVVWVVAAFMSGSKQDHVHCQRKIVTGADVGNVGFTGIVYNPSASAYLDVRARHDYASPAGLTIKYCNVNAVFISG